ncbi:MAG: hypothetical protein K8J31_01350, partial [Anaerolineae bacterium]|nr:hypothetical protein [Anaerolineae bacterium]
MSHRRLSLGILFVALALLSISPVLAAARPAMTIRPIWRPGEQLTTLASSNDSRYVDVQLLATGNVQFWAVNLACSFSPNVLESYTFDNGGGGTSSDPGDDVPMVTWGPDWEDASNAGPDFLPVSTSGSQDFDYDPVKGIL